MTDRWRQFEKFIARIEQAMAPSGAVVKSPDRIPDKLTGELREVDASIRYKSWDVSGPNHDRVPRS